jgi:hypothetical protein
VKHAVNPWSGKHPINVALCVCMQALQCLLDTETTNSTRTPSCDGLQEGPEVIVVCIDMIDTVNLSVVDLHTAWSCEQQLFV